MEERFALAEPAKSAEDEDRGNVGGNTAHASGPGVLA